MVNKKYFYMNSRVPAQHFTCSCFPRQVSFVLYIIIIFKMASHRKRAKSNSSLARRLRVLAARKKIMEAETKDVPLVPAIPVRVRWKKTNVTKQYTCEDDGTPVARAILTTSCLLSVANFMLAHGRDCHESNFQSVKIGNGKLYFDCVKCKKTFLFSQDHGKPILLFFYTFLQLYNYSHLKIQHVLFQEWRHIRTIKPSPFLCLQVDLVWRP